MTGSNLIKLVSDPTTRIRVESVWAQVLEDFNRFEAQYLNPEMRRLELGFHDQVKLLGYVSLAVENIPGDFLEIGVWKGRSLALISRLLNPSRRALGIDPFELPGQKEDASYYLNCAVPNAHVIVGRSESSLWGFLRQTTRLCALHIDGGHRFNDVITDFLVYERFLLSGGVVVFDDYGDHQNSPEVRPAVDYLCSSPWTLGYEILGPLDGYENSFVICKN